MKDIYFCEFNRISSISFSDVREVYKRVEKADLHIMSSDNQWKLVLEYPSNSSITIQELFDSPEMKSADALKIRGKKDGKETTWRIEFWKDGNIMKNIVYCKKIHNLPERGWKFTKS